MTLKKKRTFKFENEIENNQYIQIFPNHKNQKIINFIEKLTII